VRVYIYTCIYVYESTIFAYGLIISNGKRFSHAPLNIYMGDARITSELYAITSMIVEYIALRRSVGAQLKCCCFDSIPQHKLWLGRLGVR
jgi:hypothetical protein